jgi:hypothetical protein
MVVVLHRAAGAKWMNKRSGPVDRAMVMAEYDALRAEILHRFSLQWSMFALQLTAAGVVFSFSLSNPSHTGFLLILPLITYALTGRYVNQFFSVQRIARYIRDVIEVKMNGDLYWETWLRLQPPRRKTLSWLNPLLLVFPGVAVIALAWVTPYVWAGSNASTSKRVLIVTIWLIGIIVTAVSFRLISRIVSETSVFPAKATRDNVLPVTGTGYIAERGTGPNSASVSPDV